MSGAALVYIQFPQAQLTFMCIYSMPFSKMLVSVPSVRVCVAACACVSGTDNFISYFVKL